MAYQVIARKWRPQSFQELVGQDHISTTLLNALKHNRLPQALLFTGVRGTGKTSTARILAKSLRCPNAVDFVPCGACPACEDVSSGRSLDVIEIDGASNNGVDAVRELRDTIGYMPATGRYKVYIVDEVHMLSTSAFNALLKTLEEPPPHIIFILATTEAQKIPNTILSRCQRFDFRRIPSRQIAAQLEKITKSEGLSASGEALWMIARQADGSMRDSQSLLDQVITYCNGDVSLAQVVEVLGLTDRTILLEALKALAERSTEKMINVVEKIFSAGYDPKVFAQDLLEQLRNALLVRLLASGSATAAADLSKIVDLPDTEIQALRDITSAMSNEDIHLLFDMALKGVNDLLRSQDARLVLEMLLLRMASAPTIVHLAQLLSRAPQEAPLQASAKAPNTASVATATPPALVAATHRESAVPLAAAQPPPAERKFNFVRQVNPDAVPYRSQTAPSESSPMAPTTVTTAAGLDEPLEETAGLHSDDPWFVFVRQVKKSNALLGAMLENTHILSNEGTHLVLGIPKKVGFLTDKLKDPENIKRIQTFIETFWNKRYTVEIKVDTPAKNTGAASKVTTVATEQLTPRAAVTQQQQVNEKSVEQAVHSNPLVRSAQDAFKGQIKSIKERK